MNNCPICNGIGFKDGKVCRCITAEKVEKMPTMPEEFAEILGDIIRKRPKDKND